MQDDGIAEEAGEGYFASISDLMVGVLFVFLLMLTILALNFKDDTAKLAAAIERAEAAEARAEAALRDLARQVEEAQRREDEARRLREQNERFRSRLAEAAEALQREVRYREAARADLLERLEQGLKQRGIRVLLDQQSGVLRLSEEVPFQTGRSELTETTRRTVQALGDVLATTLPCFTAGAAPLRRCASTDAPILEALLVEGHTDRQPYPAPLTAAQSTQRNDELSAARALTVFAELRRLQPTLDGLRGPSDQPLLGVSGYGERRPLPGALTLDPVDLALNRRIDLRFILSSRTSEGIRELVDSITALTREPPP